MKCIICDKVAEYMDNGNSYCRKHFPKKIKKQEEFVKFIKNEFADIDPKIIIFLFLLGIIVLAIITIPSISEGFCNYSTSKSLLC